MLLFLLVISINRCDCFLRSFIHVGRLPLPCCGGLYDILLDPWGEMGQGKTRHVSSCPISGSSCLNHLSRLAPLEIAYKLKVIRNILEIRLDPILDRTIVRHSICHNISEKMNEIHLIYKYELQYAQTAIVNFFVATTELQSVSPDPGS